jgi:hypothetical protein
MTTILLILGWIAGHALTFIAGVLLAPGFLTLVAFVNALCAKITKLVTPAATPAPAASVVPTPPAIPLPAPAPGTAAPAATPSV